MKKGTLITVIGAGVGVLGLVGTFVGAKLNSKGGEAGVVVNTENMEKIAEVVEEKVVELNAQPKSK